MEWSTIESQLLKKRLDEVLSPRLRDFRLAWRGDNSWVEEGVCATRRMFRVVPLKGLRAVITWGYSLSFVPHVSGTQLRHHRTFKAARLDVFEWPQSYARSFSAHRSFECVSLLRKNFEDSLKAYFEAEVQHTAVWFDKVNGLAAIEKELRRQIASPLVAYQLHHPSPAYVLPFVVAARGNLTEAEELAIAAFSGSLAPLLPNARTCLPKAADIATGV